MGIEIEAAPTDPGQKGVPERPLASWWERAGAFLLDELIIWGFWIVAIVIVSAASSSLAPEHAFRWEVPVFWIIPQIIYFAILDGRYQSVGKLVFGIALRDEGSGRPIGVQRILRRWMLLHDEPVGSVVVKVR
jgi:uncharacterized RDD family membrane protein YckC